MIGTTLSHYRIVASLGRGGMGEVYVAEDSKLNRRVALKVLPSKLAGDPERRQRFDREAQAVAALNHPNIVTIHSVEESDGIHFITMELLEGGTLQERIPAEGLPLERFLQLAIPLADALGAAHERGIIHRDLKPSNIIAAADGRLKILDFGLAKLIEQEPSIDATAFPTQEITGEGRVVGTAAYMSPEQAEGRKVDDRSDIFSLGIIFYEMVTGQRPFRGETSVSVLSAILRDTPAPITELKQDLPRDLGRIIRRMLVKDREHRYQTSKDVRNDLEELKAGLDSGEIQTGALTAVAPVLVGRPAWLIAGVLAVVLVIGAAGSLVLWWPSREAAPRPGRFERIRLTRLTNTGKAVTAAISPDGRYVAHVAEDAGRQSLWLRQVAATTNVQIVPPAEVRYRGLTFSPDGDFVYYVIYPGNESFGNLFQIPVLGGAPRKLVEDIDSPVAFAPDGRSFAFVRGYQQTREDALIVADADGTRERKLAVRKRPEFFSLVGASWSPDGKSIAAVGGGVEGARYTGVLRVDLQTGEQKPIGAQKWEWITSVAWTPDGSSLVVAAFDPSLGMATQLWRLSYPDGAVRPITSDLNQYGDVSLTADSRLLVSLQSDQHANLWTVPLANSLGARKITSETASYQGTEGLAWSGDGQIVYVSLASGNPDIWMIDEEGRNPRQITSDPTDELDPEVSPDSRYVAFSSNRAGRFQVFVMDKDGGNTRAVSQGTEDFVPHFSQDSKWVFYVSQWSSLWKAPVGGGPPVAIFGPADPAWSGERWSLPSSLRPVMLSPDGRLLLARFVDEQERRGKMAVLPLAGGPPLLTFYRPTGRGALPNWSPDLKSVTFVMTRGGVSNLWNQPIVGGPPKQVTHFTSSRIFNFAWSPDGKKLVLSRGEETADVVLISDSSQQ
ncbi:MAG: protein kinase domain-containing protein [Acidobacteriota bacterium]